MDKIESPNGLLKYLREKKGFYKKNRASHVELVLGYVSKIMEQLNIEDKGDMLQYAAVLHDIGRTHKVIEKYSEEPHEICGAKYLLNKKKGKEILDKCGLKDDAECIAEYIRFHKTGKKDNKNSYIIMAADKLAHYDKKSEKCDESLFAIEMIPYEDIKRCAISMAKDIALKHERERSKSKKKKDK